MSYNKKDVQIIRTNPVYQGFIDLELVELKFKMYSGSWSHIVEKAVVKKYSAVAVLLFDPKNDIIILTEQFRIGCLFSPANPWHIEVVAGLIEPDISVEDTVHKEVLEEAGVKIKAIEKITEYWTSPGFTNDYFYLFCAAVDSINMPEIAGLEKENEDIKLRKFIPESIFEKIYDGEMNNAHTIICLQWMKNNYARLKEKWSKL